MESVNIIKHNLERSLRLSTVKSSIAGKKPCNKEKQNPELRGGYYSGLLSEVLSGSCTQSEARHALLPHSVCFSEGLQWGNGYDSYSLLFHPSRRHVAQGTLPAICRKKSHVSHRPMRSALLAPGQRGKSISSSSTEELAELTQAPKHTAGSLTRLCLM